MCLCLTGVATAGRANSVMNVCFILDASTGPATSRGSATVRGTGAACCVIKVRSFCFIAYHTRRWQSACSHPACPLKLQLPGLDEVSELLRAEATYHHVEYCRSNAALSLGFLGLRNWLIGFQFGLCWNCLKTVKAYTVKKFIILSCPVTQRPFSEMNITLISKYFDIL